MSNDDDYNMEKKDNKRNMSVGQTPRNKKKSNTVTDEDQFEQTVAAPEMVHSCTVQTLMKQLSESLCKEGRILLNEFARTLDCSWNEEGKKTALLSQYDILVKDYFLPPIRFLKFEDLVAHGSFPRYPNNKNLTHNLIDIDRNNSLLVFISHCWMRGHEGAEGWDGSPHPDNTAGVKFKICVEVIKLIWEVYAPLMLNCYVWFDFACMDQDSKDMTRELEHYDRIVEVCDCLFTPIVGGSMLDLENTMGSSYWNEGPGAYLNRAWCRVEMLYAVTIPVLGNDDNSDADRKSMFDSRLADAYSHNRRPHYASSYPDWLDVLPPLHQSYLDKYHPLKGYLSRESDIESIKQLIGTLQPYIDKLQVANKGDVNELGQKHGYGVFIHQDGTVYEGEWKNDKYEGRGALRRGTYGEVYDGMWKDGKRDGHGVLRRLGKRFESRRYISHVDFVGEWKNDKKHGHGIKGALDGSTFEGEWKDDTPYGPGVFRDAEGNSSIIGENENPPGWEWCMLRNSDDFLLGSNYL